MSLFLNELHQRSPQDISQFLSVVDDQEKVKGEVSHIGLNFHLAIDILNGLNIQNRILLRVNDNKHIRDSLLPSLLQKWFHHVLVHLPVRYDYAQLAALTVSVGCLDLLELTERA